MIFDTFNVLVLLFIILNYIIIILYLIYLFKYNIRKINLFFVEQIISK